MYGSPPKSPLQRGPNAALATGLGWPGDPLLQAWAGSRQVAIGATVNISRLDIPAYHEPHLLVIRVDGAPVSLRLRQQFQGGALNIDHSANIGPGGGWTFPAAGPFVLRATSLSAANAATVRWALFRHGGATLHAPWDFAVTGMVQGGAGAPGTWQNASDIGAGVNLGFPPPDRHQLGISPLSQLDFRFVDEAAAVVFAFWQQTGPIEMKHPGRGRLQVRHPGGAADIRAAIMTWNRA